jgi:hypothetical protein
MLLICQAIFSSTASAFQFEPLMLSEAAVMAQGLGYNPDKLATSFFQKNMYYYTIAMRAFNTKKKSVSEQPLHVLGEIDLNCRAMKVVATRRALARHGHTSNDRCVIFRISFFFVVRSRQFRSISPKT